MIFEIPNQNETYSQTFCYLVKFTVARCLLFAHFGKRQNLALFNTVNASLLSQGSTLPKYAVCQTRKYRWADTFKVRERQGPQWSPLRHMEQLLLVTSCDLPSGIGASLRTDTQRTDGQTDVTLEIVF